MIPRKVFTLEKYGDDDCEHNERDDFLNHLELDEAERTTVVEQSHAISGHLAHIFKERDTPREEYDHNERPVGADTVLLKLQMSVPRKRHKDVGTNEKKYGIKSLHRNTK